MDFMALCKLVEKGRHHNSDNVLFRWGAVGFFEFIYDLGNVGGIEYFHSQNELLDG